MTTYYAIKHLPTGKVMPETRGGYSYWEPILTLPKHTPRLFRTRRAAMNAATCWSQGHWLRITETESESWELPATYTVTVGANPTRVAGRDRNDLEVVAVEIAL
jgi:hypothetical protein